MIAGSYRLHRFVVAAAALALWACNGATGTMLESNQQDQTISVQVGYEVDIKLGTVGPGQFDSVPVVSSSAVRFLDAAFVGPFVPAGPRQLFRFTAQASGVAIITFPHSGMTRTVIDTIVVR